MKTIEIAGISGSGKTTLINHLVKKNNKNLTLYHEKEGIIKGLNNFKKNYLVRISLPFIKAIKSPAIRYRLSKRVFFFSGIMEKFKIKFLLKNPKLINLLINTVEEMQISLFEKSTLIRCFLEYGSKYQFVKENLSERDIFLLDEGFFLKIIPFQYKYTKPDKKIIKKYFSLVTLPDQLFYIKPNISISFKRLKKRGAPNILKSNDNQVIFKYLSNSMKTVECSLDHIHKRTKVVTIKNDGNIERTVNSIIRIIKQNLKN